MGLSEDPSALLMKLTALKSSLAMGKIEIIPDATVFSDVKQIKTFNFATDEKLLSVLDNWRNSPIHALW